MFTGLIETTGTILKRQISSGSGLLVIQPATPLQDLEYGESIAVNGTCLTLEKWDDSTLQFHALEETFKRTNLGNIALSAPVNLERALQVGARVGGHFVSGHVDATAAIKEIKPVAGDYELTIEMPPQLAPYFVEKGSIAIDGISLTLVRLSDSSFTVHLIPVTLQETNLHQKQVGDMVNLEADIIGKYVARQLSPQFAKKSSITMEMLQQSGW